MKSLWDNCKRCTLYIEKRCDGDTNECLCKKCPRNLGECIITRYCRETESVLNTEEF